MAQSVKDSFYLYINFINLNQKYRQFSLNSVVISYKFATNTELANTEVLLVGKIQH